MKKYLALIGAAILVVALASPSMAQFKTYGDLEIQTSYVFKQDFNNGSGSSATSDDNQEQNKKQIFERYHFYLEYGDAKTVRAVLGFEASSTDWGEARMTSFAGLNSDTGTMGSWMADQTNLTIQRAFVDFVIPNTPVSVTAGIQYFGIGDHLFLSADGPGLTVAANFAPHKVTGYWWRQNDENTLAYNVDDGYAVQYELSQKMWNLYAYGAYKNDLRGSQNFKDHPWWLAVGGGYRPGNWDLSAQLIYEGGTRDYGDPAFQDDTYQAYVGELYVKYNIGPGLRVVVDGFYASGTDANKNDKINLYSFPGDLSSESTAWIYNRRGVFYFMNTDLGYIGNKQWSFAGHYLGHVGFEYSPVPWAELIASYCYIGDTSSGSPGTHIDKATGLSVANQVNSVGQQNSDESFVGHEVSLIGTLKIYKNFTYTAGFGYFIPGKVFDSPTEGADAGWALLSKLLYAF